MRIRRVKAAARTPWLASSSQSEARLCAIMGIVGFGSWALLHIVAPQWMRIRYAAPPRNWFNREIAVFDIIQSVVLLGTLCHPGAKRDELSYVANSCILLSFAHAIESLSGSRVDRSHAISTVIVACYGLWCYRLCHVAKR